jgi:hypothetical protein
MCNYCRLKDIKRRAKEKGARVKIIIEDVFVIPKGEKPDLRDPDDGGKHWVAWMMEIPERCYC